MGQLSSFVLRWSLDMAQDAPVFKWLIQNNINSSEQDNITQKNMFVRFCKYLKQNTETKLKQFHETHGFIWKY